MLSPTNLYSHSLQCLIVLCVTNLYSHSLQCLIVLCVTLIALILQLFYYLLIPTTGMLFLSTKNIAEEKNVNFLGFKTWLSTGDRTASVKLIYSLPLCRASLLLASSMTQHIRMHTANNKPLKYEHCSYRAVQLTKAELAYSYWRKTVWVWILFL